MGVKITTLIENNPDDNRVLYSESGLSVYIEIDEMKILFDTGESGNFIKNAEKKSIDLGNLDYVILSHGHYDHSGGFRELVENVGNSFKLIIGKGFFNKKFKVLEKSSYKYIGNSFDESYINEMNIPVKYIEEDIFYINENIMIFFNFTRWNDYELLNEKFVIKQDENYILDDFSDEIVLAVNLQKGLIVILGCSHVGVVNILETIIKRTGLPIYGVIGGTHLVDADEQRLNKTIEFLKEKKYSNFRNMSLYWRKCITNN
ncbi:MBL fold metallo-hydrolase [Clostridium sp. SYSU_GA19001]|uniref:MBL fold metallo-hydrolase n=1 Tax=Clostridium caldaquaticum TaxID=2940653 RepID=UPI0020773FED|nr:MBL fold metallo-hydrolase [Clostridium caldaquaticum]MCM8710109.1 MBL fold metallo-hydrolase [Clostridium caldaquaticum]